MEKILIVEDDILVASDVRFMLQSFRYKVTGIANSASKALELFNSEVPDLILCDINLRTKRTGIDFVVKSRKIAIVPVIYLTAYSDAQTLSRAIQTEPESYLIKPFTNVQLHTSVLLALEKNKSKNDNSNGTQEDIIPPTTRELEILQLLIEGLSSRKIADKLNISFLTVQTHRKRLMHKLNVNNTIDLISKAQAFQLIK